MNDIEELEFLIKVAEDRIRFFDSYKVEPVPQDLGEQLQRAFRDIAASHSLGPEHLKTLQESKAILDRTKSDLVKQFSDTTTFNKNDIYEIIRQQFGRDMYKFFIHDKTHLTDGITHIGFTLDFVVNSTLPFDQKDILDLLVRQAKKTNSTMKKTARMYAHPWRLIRYLALTKLGERIEYVPVDMRQHLIDTAEVVGTRFLKDTRIYDSKPTNPPSNSIIIYGDNPVILADHGLIWSIIYNNMKNSEKKFSEEMTPNQKILYASCHELGDYVAVVFNDSGSALNINKMITNIRKGMLNKDTDCIDWVTPKMKQRLLAWSDNDYAFNLVTMEDISNVAFMARMSGAETPSQFSSGMGLYGTRYIVEHLGGAVLYTTTFKDENPVFTYILSKEPKVSRKGAQLLRRKIIDGKQLVA